MNDMTHTGGSAAPATQGDRDHLIEVLGNSLYVGAKPESIGMVLDYCASMNLDPMKKPVHIVPMSVKNPQTGGYEFRDTVMPGIGFYRIQADRSGNMAGISEPEFGPERTEKLNDKNGKPVEVTFPEWCRVTARKIVGEHIVEFVAKEYWLENYATDSGKSDAPNAMWRKRPRGQIAKCAEAQALRKGWPEIGAAPTAEEMEGKHLEPEARDVTPSMHPSEATVEKAALPHYPEDRFEANFDAWKQAIDSGNITPEKLITTVSSTYQLTEEQKQKIRDMKAAEPAAEEAQ